MSSTEKQPATSKTKEQSKLSEIFDWKMLMTVKGDGKGLYYTRVNPHPKTGMMGMARIDMTKKLTTHFHNVRPVEFYLMSHSGVFFDAMHKNVENEMSFDNAAITAIEEVNDLIQTEYKEAMQKAKEANEALPVKPKDIQMYNSTKFVNWYIFINQVLAEMTKNQSKTKKS